MNEVGDAATRGFVLNGHPRAMLGQWGQFQVVDLLLPPFVSIYTGVPMLYTYLGQTFIHYKMGIETPFTSYLLPTSLFPR